MGGDKASRKRETKGERNKNKRSISAEGAEGNDFHFLEKDEKRKKLEKKKKPPPSFSGKFGGASGGFLPKKQNSLVNLKDLNSSDNPRQPQRSNFRNNMRNNVRDINERLLTEANM